MGRFETVVEFYGYREPYPPEFFETIAAKLALTNKMRMLDVGCGPGNLATGFAPFVGSCTAIDREPEMLRAARSAAGTNVNIDLIQIGMEDLECGNSSFDFVTIGRALHWLSREATLPVLERIVAPSGSIAVCGSTATDAPVNAWVAKFKEVRRAWSSESDESFYKMDMDHWFAPSRFRKSDDIAVKHRHRVTIPGLIGRALSLSTTSPAVLGERRPQFEAELRTALEPFAQHGSIEEEIAAKAMVFR